MCSREQCDADHDDTSHTNEDINSNSTSNTFGEHIINIKLRLLLLQWFLRCWIELEQQLR